MGWLAHSLTPHRHCRVSYKGMTQDWKEQIKNTIPCGYWECECGEETVKKVISIVDSLLAEAEAKRQEDVKAMVVEERTFESCMSYDDAEELDGWKAARQAQIEKAKLLNVEVK